MTAAGPRVFITGASSGIGAALAARYARDGATLGLFARRESALRELAAALSSAVPPSGSGLSRHRIYPGDVCDHAALAAAARDFIAHAGGIDIVIASAGISHGTLTEVPEDLPVFEAIIATNVTATVATFGPFIDAYRSFGVAGKVRRSAALMESYKVEYWPLIIVDGRWQASPSLTGEANKELATEAAQQQATTQVLDFLVTKAKAEKK